MRGGEDPLEVLAELPEVDDDVVRALRDDALEAEGRLGEYALARHLGRGSRDSRGSRAESAWYAEQADALDARIFRAIGLAHPELTRAAWRALARVADASGSEVSDHPQAPRG